MRHLSKLTVLFLGSAFIVCADGPTDLSDQAVEVGSPAFTVIGGDNPEGAIVLNKGAASEPFVCPAWGPACQHRMRHFEPAI